MFNLVNLARTLIKIKSHICCRLKNIINANLVKMTKIEDKTLRVLEWQTVLTHLSGHATSEIGKQRCLETPVFSDIDRIECEQRLTSEAKLLLDHSIMPPFGGIRNVEESINLARINQVLRNRELIDIANTVGASRKLKSFFSRYQEEAPTVFAISTGLFENRELEENILSTFDESANILDTASSELKRLKTSQKDQLFNVKNKLNHLIQSASFSKYLQETMYTQREDRFVVPVKAEFKSLVPGIVHDISSSGATIFVEPKSIIEMNNAIRETELRIDYEVKRILAELTEKVRLQADEILGCLELLAEVDFIFAKAKYSIALKASEPKLSRDKYISLTQAKHPILMTIVENVIPNNVEIGKDWNSLIITGSNTGGKTVILKTVGLCTLMAKAGLHVPAIEATIYPFDRIFADIGDEQSVIQSLSTFSGHMVNIINIVNQSNDESLILLDEIGAGTDPSEGSALAQAVLEEFQRKGARTIVTTHYGELKALAYTKTGFYNASVEFDTETLAPTYKLLIGIPGKSNAITIAHNLGLLNSIIDEAQHIYLTQKDPTGEVMEGLQNTQQELSKNALKIEETREELEKLEREYNEKLDKIRTEKKQALNVYKKKFDSEITRARTEIKDILEEIRRTKSEKVARRSFARLSQIELGLRTVGAQESEDLEPQFVSINWDEVKVGDTVLIKDLNQVATLLGLPDRNGNVQVEMGLIKTNVKTNRLAGAAGKQVKKVEKVQKGYKFRRSSVSNTFDIRGMTVNDALDKLDYYLDEASLANLSPVYIIHGHGTGALRQAIRDYLSTSPYVSKFRPGELVEGGDGVSVVELA